MNMRLFWKPVQTSESKKVLATLPHDHNCKSPNWSFCISHLGLTYLPFLKVLYLGLCHAHTLLKSLLLGTATVV